MDFAIAEPSAKTDPTARPQRHQMTSKTRAILKILRPGPLQRVSRLAPRKEAYLNRSQSSRNLALTSTPLGTSGTELC
jgi:hypothetical protein